MKISDFDYNLPEDRIAIYPPEIRGDSNLLVLNRADQSLEDHKYSDIIDYMNSGDVLVLNKTKVISARFSAQKSSGGNIEFIVLEKHGEKKDLSRQKIMYRGKVKAQDELQVSSDVVNRQACSLRVTNILGNGIAEISCDKDLYEIAQENGAIPIPPYLDRESEKIDEERYQTVFAKDLGSVAAPTASLNFTEELKEKLINKGVIITYLTLHVGLGTFLPVREDDVEKHEMHSEYFEIPVETITAIQNAKSHGNKVIALGTTVTRTLEFAADPWINFNDNYINPGKDGTLPLQNTGKIISGEANIFIYPGFKFKIVDKLITNFHAPRSTVLLLASAFAGKDFLQKAYDHAIDKEYKFLSYGDSMIIL